VKRLLNYAEAAERIGRTPKALRNLVHRGEVPVIKHGRIVRFDIYDLDQWIEDHREIKAVAS
jgi:excisionase family DNA binding protein